MTQGLDAVDSAELSYAMRAARSVALVLVLPCLASLTSCNCGDVGSPDAGVTEVSLSRLEAAIVDLQGDIVLLQTDGGTALLVLRAAVGSGPPVSLRWNPQGTRLAYADGDLVYVREADGGVQVQGRHQGGRYRQYTSRVEWSPDGTRLAIDGVDDATDGYALFLVVPDGGEPEFVSWVDRWAWEPSGQGLLFTLYDVTAAAPLTHRYDLATGDAGLYLDAELLDSSPRGGLVFQRTQPASDGGLDVAVLAGWPDGGPSRLLPLGGGTVSQQPTAVSCSPFADEAVLEVNSARADAFELWRAPFTGGPRRLLESSRLPSCRRFVPGGEYFSYVSRDSVPKLMLVARDGVETELGAGQVELIDEFGCVDWRLRP